VNTNASRDMPCNWILETYRDAAARSIVGVHRKRCDSCRSETAPFFQDLQEKLDLHVRAFREAAIDFEMAIERLAANSDQPGNIDPSTALLIQGTAHLLREVLRVNAEFSDDTLTTMLWLPQAFTLCRLFESERLVEKQYSFASGKPPFVESMPVGIGGADNEFATFGDVTNPSHMLHENLPFGTFSFNFDLQKRIQEELHAGQYVHALKLICDSPKHGVMSSFLNILYTAHPEQILCIGLAAATIAVTEFSLVNNLSGNAADNLLDSSLPREQQK